MPITEYPRKLIPTDYWPPPGVKHYFKTGERWESIAAHYEIDVKVLIRHNFKTTKPNEVNWYLEKLIGCKYSADGGVNYAFKTGEGFGYIVIPASTVNMEAEEYVAPEDMIDRLKSVITVTPKGVVRQRIQCLLAKADQVGFPAAENWWYYSSQPTLIYTNWHTTNDVRRLMTLSTGGNLPFDGYASSATGNWRTYPFRNLSVECANGCSLADLKHKLELIEEDFRKSFHYVARADNTSSGGGGGGYGPLVEAFVKHVYALSQSPNHLYSCGGVGPAQFYWFPQ